MERRIIYHIDVNSAFLSWEACYRIHHLGGKVDLREQVAVVGGDVTMRHGIILAKSIPAKQYNIKTGESILEAKQKCPDLIIVPPNYNLYEQCSSAFINILREYSDMVEQYSIDEAFVDMTATCHLFGTPEETAYIIKNRIRDELGFTVNIGISTNKLLAKMASDFKKPDAGIVRGEQIEIACQSWTTCSGKTTPLMLKIQDEDGEVHTIRQIHVESQERKNYAGIPSVEYDCIITLLGKQFPAKIIHYLTEGRWTINLR